MGVFFCCNLREIMNGQMVNSMMANREPILNTDRHSAIQELTRLIQQIVPDSGQQNPQTLAQQVEQSVYNSVFKISGSRVGLLSLFGMNYRIDVMDIIIA